MSNGMAHKKLSSILVGSTVTIVDYDELNMPVKMLEMGLLPGNLITVKQIAPLNDPMHIQVAGYDLALRREEADHILVSEIDINQVKVG